MKYTNKAKLNNDIIENLGVGYSLDYLLKKLGITYDELCMHCADYPATQNQLKMWYKGYDFTPNAKEPTKPLKRKKKEENTQNSDSE